MVLISSKKYACETCIKGHRSSACKHTDRPLFEIKKKGRPVTQCEHCRELRKTKQVHVKCICEFNQDSAGPASSSITKKGNNKVPESATFPHGLPEALEASVALQLSSEGGSSDSDLGGACSCFSADGCHCFTPRKSAPRNKRKGVSHPPQLSADNASHDINPTELKGKHAASSHSSRTPSSHILARIAELRPVLPKPANRDRAALGPMHDPSSGIAHGHGVRHHTHENMFFSPYGRAYDSMHATDHPYDDRGQVRTQEINRASPSLFDNQTLSDQLQALQAASTSWNLPEAYGSNSGGAPRFPSACGCEDCGCPGCVEHNGSRLPPSPSAFSSCTNPGACGMCLDCTILSLPTSLPPNTALSIYDPYQTQSVDDWIRQLSAPNNSDPPLPSTSDLPPFGQDQAYAHPPWDTFHMPRIPGADRPFTGRRCPTECRCPPGPCECDSKNYERDRNRDYEPFGSGGGSSLTFATSGERASCCPGEQEPAYSTGGRGLSAYRDPLINPPGHPGRGYMTAAGTSRSRSSSTSSQSSHFSSGQASINSMGTTSQTSIAAPVGRVLGPMRPVLHKKIQSTPSLNVRPTHLDMHAPRSSCSSTSISPPPSASGRATGVTYAGSNPDSEASLDDSFSQYDPSLDGMQLY